MWKADSRREGEEYIPRTASNWLSDSPSGEPAICTYTCMWWRGLEDGFIGFNWKRWSHCNLYTSTLSCSGTRTGSTCIVRIWRTPSIRKQRKPCMHSTRASLQLATNERKGRNIANYETYFMQMAPRHGPHHPNATHRVPPAGRLFCSVPQFSLLQHPCRVIRYRYAALQLLMRLRSWFHPNLCCLHLSHHPPTVHHEVVHRDSQLYYWRNEWSKLGSGRSGLMLIVRDLSYRMLLLIYLVD